MNLPFLSLSLNAVGGSSNLPRRSRSNYALPLPWKTSYFFASWVTVKFTGSPGESSYDFLVMMTAPLRDSSHPSTFLSDSIAGGVPMSSCQGASDNKSAATHRQGDEETDPFIAAVEGARDPGGVKNQHPHRRQKASLQASAYLVASADRYGLGFTLLSQVPRAAYVPVLR
jgi:hypothetical protein